MKAIHIVKPTFILTHIHFLELNIKVWYFEEAEEVCKGLWPLLREVFPQQKHKYQRILCHVMLLGKDNGCVLG